MKKNTCSQFIYSAAVANGGGVAAGSLVAILQSAGAVGIGAGASAAIGNQDCCNYL